MVNEEARKVKRIGLLSGGGDCPGINAVIRAVVRKALQEGCEVVGIRDGWKGLIENDHVKLGMDSVSGILAKGGTILGTSRTNPYKKEGDLKKLLDNYKKLNLDALIAIGGEDTLGVASKLVEEGLPIVGVPKTIDNDLSGTDVTFGFDSAINIVTEAIDRLHSTAESHHRVMVVEIMGRHAGWIATKAGLAGGADVILIPEIQIDIDEVCDLIKKRRKRGKTFSIVAVSEGAAFKKEKVVTQLEKLDEFGHVLLGGIGRVLADMIQEKTGFEARVTVLGYLQRGGAPTAFDRVLATRFGVKAVEETLNENFGQMVCFKGNKIGAVPIEEAVGKLKTVDMELYEIAKIFFG